MCSRGAVTIIDRVRCLNTGAVLQAVCFVCAGHGGARQAGHAQGAERRRCGACHFRMHNSTIFAGAFALLSSLPHAENLVDLHGFGMDGPQLCTNHQTFKCCRWLWRCLICRLRMWGRCSARCAVLTTPTPPSALRPSAVSLCRSVANSSPGWTIML